MSSLRSCSAATALILAASLSPALLVAQQDSTMMSHDSMMAMPADTGMAMSHDSTMMDHGNMMNHMDAMSFTGAAGQKAAGGYELAENPGGKRQLTLGNDFSVTPGSDLYLVLANGAAPDGKALWIGKLKQPTGTQTYDLPKGKDLAGYSTLLVYSRKTKATVASAEWHATSAKMMEHQ
jgi:hypothetical protein